MRMTRAGSIHNVLSVTWTQAIQTRSLSFFEQCEIHRHGNRNAKPHQPVEVRQLCHASPEPDGCQSLHAMPMPHIDIDEEFEKELKEKNIKRVLPQVIKTAKIQMYRITAHMFASILTGFAVGGGFVFTWIPGWLHIVCFFLFPSSILGIFSDLAIYKRQKRKIQYIKLKLSNTTQQDGDANFDSDISPSE